MRPSKEALEWFPFYWHAFDEATREFTNEQAGAYMRLLSYQWHYGSIPDDRVRAGRITGEALTQQTWEVLRTKFIEHRSVPSGRLVNLKMQQVRKAQVAKFDARSAANRENGRKGGIAKALKYQGSVANRQRFASDSLANGWRMGGEILAEEEKKEDIRLTTTVVPKNSVSDSKNLRGTPRTRVVPPGFKISEDVRRWARALPELARCKADAIDAWLARELAKFKDHEFNSPKKHWDQTFRNWLRRCVEIGNLPTGGALAVDEEKRRQDVLKLATVFNAKRGADESFEDFEARVTKLNEARLARLKTGGPP